MRVRAIREGSVGLLILVGVGLFGVLVLWLRGLNLGQRNYNITVAFENTSGMLVGTNVRYRGVAVGRVIEIEPSSNQVNVLVEITQPGLRMPQEVRVEANQSGFIGETTVDITPLEELTEAAQAISPTAGDCDSSLIVCDGDRLNGIVGISYEALLRSTEALASTLSDPALINNLKTTLENAAVFAEQGTALADELTQLTTTAVEELGPISEDIREATESATSAVQEIQLTAADARSLLAANRFNLTNTLDNISQGSDRQVFIADTLSAELEEGQLLDNLETLSINAAQASTSLREVAVDISDITRTVNQPENLLIIQQTLESARDVFQSVQKILSDVDELTGDPTIRDQIRDLLNGLTDLLSSIQILEQQVELATALAPLDSISTPIRVPVPSRPTQLSTTTDYRRLQAQLEAFTARKNTATD